MQYQSNDHNSMQKIAELERQLNSLKEQNLKLQTQKFEALAGKSNQY